MIIEKDAFINMLDRLNPETRPVVESLIDNVIFMQRTLNNLAERINTEGVIISRTNGNKVETTGENPALKSYNTTVRNYAAVCKTLAQFLPNPDDENEDELMQYLKGKMKPTATDRNAPPSIKTAI